MRSSSNSSCLSRIQVRLRLLAGQQELHGRPTDAAVPQQVDQMDQDRHAQQRKTPEQWCVNDRKHELGEDRFLGAFGVWSNVCPHHQPKAQARDAGRRTLACASG